MTETCASAQEFAERLGGARAQGKRIGLVPTMGNLHRGHIQLVATARQHADISVASIYVNPTQFGENEDFASYPRTLDSDLEMLREAGCDYAFVPDDNEMYPQQPLTRIAVPDLASGYCSTDRPGHFAGVCQAVARLLNMVQPHLAVFGEKDFQQLQIVRRLVADLAFPVEIIGAPTVREADGLAMSSRNGYLSEAERAIAPGLYAALCAAAEQLQAGEKPRGVLKQARAHLKSLGFRVEYLELADADSLKPASAKLRQSARAETQKSAEPVKPAGAEPNPANANALKPANGKPEKVDAKPRKLVLLTAVRLGKTRLIDNLRLELP